MSDVINLCGEYPENFEKVDISNNPNFVFIADDNFNSVLLYDSVGNSVLVNSFLECEHYVSGGWNFEPSVNEEIILQNYLSILLILLIGFKFISQKLKKFVK